MIIEWLVSLGIPLSGWFASLFPADWEVPEFVTELDSFVSALFVNASGMGAWVDISYITGIVSTVLGVWVICLGIKVIRAVVAHVPLAGGSG